MTTSSSSQTSQRKLRSKPGDYTVSDFNRMWDENEEFRAYARQVYHYLDTMRPGRRLSLLRIPDNRIEWMMIIAVAFIDEGVHFLTYEFTDDFTAIRHTRADDWETERAVEFKYGKLL